MVPMLRDLSKKRFKKYTFRENKKSPEFLNPVV